MSRMLATMALLGALLTALCTTGAVANVAMATTPAIDLTWTPTYADPADVLVMASSYGYTLYYTVTDHDTFTPGPPPMPPPPYNGPASHDDNTKMTDFEYDEEVPDILGYIVTGGDWTHERQYSVWVGNNNDTGYLRWATIGPTWDDQALGPQGVPANQVTGSANDDPAEFTKELWLMP